MSDLIGILIDNLKETLKAIERCLLQALLASGSIGSPYIVLLAMAFLTAFDERSTHIPAVNETIASLAAEAPLSAQDK